MKPLITAISMSTFALASSLYAQELPAGEQPQVDYDSFIKLTAEVAPYRETRLLKADAFFAMADKEGALLLDTRSAADFQMGHIEGAVNLPFSEFTEGKLRDIIGDDLGRPILIYCNNNFSDNAAPIALKRASLALNIPTFINLYGYGYKNVWELDGVMSTKDVAWTSAVRQLAASN
jgi:rhodanese-related sulfurtransferase